MHEYIVRESPRAKRVLIKLSPREGLVVVVPRGFDHDRDPVPGAGEERVDRAQNGGA